MVRCLLDHQEDADATATARGVHPGEILISGTEALRPAVWIQVLKLAEVRLLSRRNRA